MPRPASIEWLGATDGSLRLLDQRKLPIATEFQILTSVEGVFHAIKSLAVRGAPAIGITAAYGLVIAAQSWSGSSSRQEQIDHLVKQGDFLKSSRPTAVNLAWAVDRVIDRVQSDAGGSCSELAEVLLAEARAIHAEDAAMCRAIAENGVRFVLPGSGILTHCNTGYLATGGDGTALAIAYEARRRNIPFTVFADETRPLLQGSRLTAWELQQEGIPVTLITDSMAALIMAQGKVQLAIVGADRIAANGDTANKIGTYSVATLAAAHGIPFVVAAPSSTFDLALSDGAMIPIEERADVEITNGFGTQTAPTSIPVYNPAFDVTPARLIHAIVTERGVISPVTPENVRLVLRKS